MLKIILKTYFLLRSAFIEIWKAAKWGCSGQAVLYCLVRKHVVKKYMSMTSVKSLQGLSKLDICQ